MILIGEKINSSIKYIWEAINSSDEQTIQDIAMNQIKAGADYLDINAGIFAEQEPDKLKWLMETIRKVTPSPLVIDSPSPAALSAALGFYSGSRPIINSISLEQKRFDPVLEVVMKYNTKVIALCMDDTGLPDNISKHISIAETLIMRLEEKGLKQDDIFFDPLIRPVSTGSEESRQALESIGELRRLFPQAHIVCGLSNISFGLPSRHTLNRAFLVAAMVKGLDSAILDPLDNELMALYYAARTLLGEDENCSEYLLKYRETGFQSVI